MKQLICPLEAMRVCTHRLLGAPVAKPGPTRQPSRRCRPNAQILPWRRRVGHQLLAVLFLAFGLVLFTGCGKTDSGTGAKRAATHLCPMHPTYTDDRASDCPICGMRLTPIKDGGASGAAESNSVPGRVTLMVSAEKRQKIGLTTALVEKRNLSNPLRATATVAHDETRLTRIAPRFGGWVRELKVNFTGSPVEVGQPLLTVYSPELFTAENEYLLAWRNARSLSNSPPAEREAAARMAESAARRLQLLQVGPDELRSLEQVGRPSEERLLRSPVAGHVLGKNTTAGKAFMAGDTLFEIADLDHLWLRVAVFEFDLPEVRVGQKATVHFPYLNRQVDSVVTFISPHIDPQTRRAEVRIEIDNPGRLIRPDMWATVELDRSRPSALSVPASAVMDTGSRQIVFVDRDDEHLEPREVKLGMRGADHVEVLSGVAEGERVVARALFMVDSESQLKAALAGMAPDAKTNAAPLETGGPH